MNEKKFTGCRLNDTQYSIDDFRFSTIIDLVNWHCRSTNNEVKELFIDYRNIKQYRDSGGNMVVHYVGDDYNSIKSIKITAGVCEVMDVVEFK